MGFQLLNPWTALRAVGEAAMAASLVGAFLVAAIAVGLPCAALGETLRPMQAGSFAMNDWMASVYYTETGGGYEVVTTVAPVGDGTGAPIRYVVDLSPGQSTTVEIGSFDTMTSSVVLAIQREADGLTAALLPGAAVPVAMD